MHPKGPFVVLTREEGEQNDDKSPTFVHTFQLYCVDVQRYLMEPLFFAVIGFAIPFLNLWNGGIVWRGILYTVLMLLAKVQTSKLPSQHLLHQSSWVAHRQYLDAIVEPFYR
jgi:NhaP-type Na+/H+ or K+/H+ antiporter